LVALAGENNGGRLRIGGRLEVEAGIQCTERKCGRVGIE
jgi:hypothetical protein